MVQEYREDTDSSYSDINPYCKDLKEIEFIQSEVFSNSAEYALTTYEINGKKVNRYNLLLCGDEYISFIDIDKNLDEDTVVKIAKFYVSSE